MMKGEVKPPGEVLVKLISHQSPKQCLQNNGILMSEISNSMMDMKQP